MARIRSVKPELRRSLTVSSWKRETRYAWVLLWGYLDDYGYGVDDLRLITSDLFPLDRDVTERKMNGWLNEMTTPGMDGEQPALCRFEVAGRRYLHAVKWSEHQKPAHPTASRYPACPVHGATRWPRKPGGKPEGDESNSGDPPEDFMNGSGEIHDPLANGSRTIPLAPAPASAETGDGRREEGDGSKGAGKKTSSDGPSSDLTQPRETADHHGEILKLLAEEIHATRADWPVSVIAAVAGEALTASGSMHRTTIALTFIANLPDSQTPQRVLAPGWWWDEGDTRYEQALDRLEAAS